MRFLRKAVMKLVTMLIMVALLGTAMRYARPYLMKSAGLPTGMPTSPGGTGPVHFSSEESDLMGTVFKSAIRLLTGQADRKQLAGELSAKLYAGQADQKTMSELGIELVQPGRAGPARPGMIPAVPAGSPPTPGTDLSAPGQAARLTDVPPDANPLPKPGTPPNPGQRAASDFRGLFLTRLQNKAIANPELALAPVVLTGMLVVHGVRRRRRSPLDDLVLPDMAALMPSDSAPYEMTHAVHALRAEDFELLVALVYQRQGYRVTMPAGLSGGRGGDFMLQRKSERLLVQCKNTRQDFRLPVERVRELQEAVTTAGATRGLFVASCGFTWDARNFAKTKGLTVINARTLDALITEARTDADEDLLAVPRWAEKFMAKVKLTPPVCPTCEAEMEQIAAGGGVAWVCSQRPDCRGRRNARSYQNVTPSTVQAKPARPARSLDLAKITKPIHFTKLTESINLTKLTKFARAATVPAPVPPAARAATPTTPARPSSPAKPAEADTPAPPPAPATPAAADVPASEPEEPPLRPARLLAAFPSPRQMALVTRRIFSSRSSPGGESGPAPRGKGEGQSSPAAAAKGKPVKV